MEIAAAAAPCKKDLAAGQRALEPQLLGVPMKWISLVSLTLQTTLQVLVIKWARAEAPRGPQYLASTVVLFTEVLKTCVSFALVAAESGGVTRAGELVVEHVARDPLEALKICVPSLLYTVQNNLMFFSLGKLSAAVQQVTYQLKILTTALLSVLILGKSLTATKWCALLLLLGGIALVQWPRDDADHPAAAPITQIPRPEVDHLAAAPALPNAPVAPASPALVPHGKEALLLAGWGVEHLGGDEALGFVAVLAACFTSGLASVYLEKLLKQTDASIWMRNVQLGVFGTLMALTVALAQDASLIEEGGLFQGYTVRVACVVATNALGGLLCAAVLKYADNILRCFSTALSILLTCVVSFAVLQEETLDLLFVGGAALAVAATFLYSAGPPPGIGSVCQLAKGLGGVGVAPSYLAGGQPSRE